MKLFARFDGSFLLAAYFKEKTAFIIKTSHKTVIKNTVITKDLFYLR